MLFDDIGAEQYGTIPPELPIFKYDYDRRTGQRREGLVRPSQFTTDAIKEFNRHHGRKVIGYFVTDGATKSAPRFMSLQDAQTFRSHIEEGRTVIVDYAYSNDPEEIALKKALTGFNVNNSPLAPVDSILR